MLAKELLKKQRIAHLLALSTLVAGTLAACGGGGGGATPAPPPPPPAPSGLVAVDFNVATSDRGGDGDGGGVGGAAGDGAPIKRATVVVLDRTGKRFTGQTDDNGNYLVSTAGTMAAPVVVKVIDAGGKVLTSVVNETITTGVFKRAMVNPLTDKIVSDALLSGVSGTDKSFDGSKVDASKISQATADLRTSIQAALSLAGVTNTAAFNAISDRYAYNGTGVDTVLDSIAHTRNPATGNTELRAKLAGLNTDANGVVQPTLVTALTPLENSQVATAASGALNFEKLNNWIKPLNECLSTDPALANGPNCNDAYFQDKVFGDANYKHNGKDRDEDFVALCSEADRSCIKNSTFRNPVVLYLTRTASSTVDNIAVVEFTIRQPRTGPLAGNSTTPIEYTKVVVFRRDDTTPGLAAGNWIAYGNQRNFDWFVEPRYSTLVQQNPAKNNFVSGGVPSRTISGIRLGFNTFKFDYANRNSASRGYIPSDVFAIRIKGPGLPAAGVVYALNTLSGAPYFAILNKTGVIPAPGTTTTRPQADFRISGVQYPNGAAYPVANWPGNPTGGNLPHYSDNPSAIDFVNLKAFSRYTIEAFTNAAPATPIVETGSVLAGIETPGAYVQRPLHDLSPSLSLITPSVNALTGTVATSWVRNPEAVRIDSSFFLNQDLAGLQLVSSINLPDRNNINPTSTSVSITLNSSVPAFNTSTVGAREVGLVGRAARASFSQSVYWNN